MLAAFVADQESLGYEMTLAERRAASRQTPTLTCNPLRPSLKYGNARGLSATPTSTEGFRSSC